jgi:hypothetical protein
VTARLFPKSKHKVALAVACPVCAAPVGQICTGLETSSIGHAARHHAHTVTSKPEPDAYAIQALHQIDGQRADARPFVAWLSGGHDFRLPGSKTGCITMQVYVADTKETVISVRRVLVDLAARYGLLVLAGNGGRGRYTVTERGLAFHAAWLREQEHREQAAS